MSTIAEVGIHVNKTKQDALYIFAIVKEMISAAIFSFGVIVAEASLWLPVKSWLRGRTAATLGLLVISTTWLLYHYLTVTGLLFLVLSLYRVINLARFYKGRRQPEYLYTLTRSASLWLLAASVIIVTVLVIDAAMSGQILLLLAISLAFIASLVITGATLRNLRKTRPVIVEPLTGTSVPTLSVLIPARNETEDLEECLRTLVASRYDKLEIIVLDDCSQNTRTPEIIKGFAHDGVRFMAGEAAPPYWTAKNYAYQQLSQVASGDLLLFCGVDTRFQPETLGIMVAELKARDKQMISYLPANKIPPLWPPAQALVQAARYSWELSLPRRSLDRPPVLSTAWLVYAQPLQSAGGFSSARRATTPERVLARYFAQSGDAYSFVQSDTHSGVRSQKSASEQVATAVRTRYPQLHQSLELTALVSLLEFTVLVLPFVLYGITLWSRQMFLFAIVDVTAILLILNYAQVSNVTHRKFLWRSLLAAPLTGVYDILLLNYSMYKYEFSSVEWKGRNVCIPVMRVIDHLPND